MQSSEKRYDFIIAFCHLSNILARFCQEAMASVELKSSRSLLSPKMTL